ncbi:hypothetical protein FGG08_002680 [Glutinoglossum americanum]|uniref:Ubiquitin 3 binding protein But2 C-terminal domain-containing protein n=1 Tax=Glutinoglossum americanum TaxID=1670608 RepID=A0A9P8IER9_9PEZI|nr:hypothetical protein FGG08_002680 [Glutinoglossum americanum]
MQRLLIWLAAALSLASAVPTIVPDEQTPLALVTTTVYPSLMKYIDSSNPSYVAPNTIQFPNSLFLTYYSPNPSPSYRLDSLISFTGIPKSAKQCALRWAFPPGWQIYTVGVSLLNIYSVDRQAKDGDSWNNAPKEVSLWGTTRLSSGSSGYVNSAVCDKSMTFRIEISRDSGGMGEVTFAQSNGPSHWGQPPAGWYLTYE